MSSTAQQPRRVVKLRANTQFESEVTASASPLEHRSQLASGIPCESQKVLQLVTKTSSQYKFNVQAHTVSSPLNKCVTQIETQQLQFLYTTAQMPAAQIPRKRKAASLDDACIEPAVKKARGLCATSFAAPLRRAGHSFLCMSKVVCQACLS